MSTQRLWDAFQAGFEISGEGYNAEYPPVEKIELTEHFEKWLKDSSQRATNPVTNRDSMRAAFRAGFGNASASHNMEVCPPPEIELVKEFDKWFDEFEAAQPMIIMDEVATIDRGHGAPEMPTLFDDVLTKANPSDHVYRDTRNMTTDQIRVILRNAIHLLSQYKAAIEELSVAAWPDSCPLFLAWHHETNTPVHVPPEKVQGFYEAFRIKLQELGDWSQFVQDGDDNKDLRKQVQELGQNIKDRGQRLFQLGMEKGKTDAENEVLREEVFQLRGKLGVTEHQLKVAEEKLKEYKS